MTPDDYLCRKCGQSMYVPDGMDPLEENVRFCESCAIQEIERLLRLTVEAERSVKILRGELVDREKDDEQAK